MTAIKKIDLIRNLVGVEDKENNFSILINPDIEMIVHDRILSSEEIVEHYLKAKKESDKKWDLTIVSLIVDT